MMTTAEQTKNRFINIFTCAGVILPSALLFSIKSDMPHILLICIFFMMTRFIMKKPLEYRERPVLYGFLAALLMMAIPEMMVKMDPSRMGYIDYMFRTNIFVPTLLYTSVLFTLFRRSPFSCSLIATFAFYVCLICGDIVSVGHYENTRFPVPSFVFQNYETIYLGILSITTFFVLIMIGSDTRYFPWKNKTSGAPKTTFSRLTVKICCILLVPAAAYGIGKVYLANEANYRNFEQILIKWTAGMDFYHRRSQGYSERIQIEYIQTPESKEQQNQVLIWAKSSFPPGYLRSTVYSFFKDGAWYQLTSEPEKMTGIYRTDTIVYNTFYFDGRRVPEGSQNEEEQGDITVDIFLDGSISRHRLPMLGNTTSVDIVADELFVTKNGEIFPDHTTWKRDGAYTLHIPAVDQMAAYPNPPGNEITTIDYLHLASSLVPELDALAREIFPDGLASETTMSIIEKTTQFFHNEFSYSLAPRRAPKGVDPISDFIMNSRTGHCELFATVETLLLRHLGIQSRYVVGYICAQPHSTKIYYFSTGRNTHAWCEAYIPEEDRWILVEPTPPSVFDDMYEKNEQGFFADWWNGVRYLLRESMAMIRRGYLGEFIISAFLFLFTLIFRSPFIFVIIAFVIIKVRKRYGARIKKFIEDIRGSDKNILIIRAQMRSLEFHITRKLHLHHRAPGETLREWSFSIENENLRASVLNIVDEYESLRFRNAPVSGDHSAHFKNHCIQIRKEIRAAN